jgi:DNA-binding NtrC family response regulator
MKGTILIVDDDTIVGESLAKALRKKGYEPLLAADGIEAFERCKQNLPDLVLLDLNMPRQSGWVTLEKISKLNPLTPVIIITGSPDQPEPTASARFRALMVKPLDVPLLIRVVEQLIEETISKRSDRLHVRPRSQDLS